ncbi:MAG TPA: MerR family transcriptional regulator [Acidobacteriaceae bacterium]|nr:MerR family transcriptional regulator [Acidobacteriaceae bacterium]
MPKAATSKHGKSKAQREIVIPDKLYFRIGDVAKLCGVETYVLRFWETEFPQMRPNKSGTGQRLYRKKDVELALKVRRLLHDEGYTIAGARQVLAQEAGIRKSPQLPLLENGSADRARAMQAKLQKVRGELREILGMLSAAPRRTQAKTTHPANRAGTRPSANLFE